MTDHGAPPIEDLGAKWADEWADFPLRQRDPSPTGPPWYRAPGLLISVIGISAVTLVAAAALLVADTGSGEIPTGPPLSTRAPAATAAPAVVRPAPPTDSSSAPMPQESAQPSPGPDQAPEPSQAPDAPPRAAVPEAAIPEDAVPEAAPPEDAAPEDTAGPRTNVTRSPMSFTPGSSGR